MDLEETHKVARSREINVGGGFGDFDDDEDRLFGNEFDDDLYVHIRETLFYMVLWSLTHAPSHYLYSNDMALGDDNDNWLALTTQPASRPSTAPSVGSRAQDSSSVAGSYTSSHGRRHHRLSFRSRKVWCGAVSFAHTIPGPVQLRLTLPLCCQQGSMMDEEEEEEDLVGGDEEELPTPAPAAGGQSRLSGATPDLEVRGAEVTQRLQLVYGVCAHPSPMPAVCVCVCGPDTW